VFSFLTVRFRTIAPSDPAWPDQDTGFDNLWRRYAALLPHCGAGSSRLYPRRPACCHTRRPPSGDLPAARRVQRGVAAIPCKGGFTAETLINQVLSTLTISDGRVQAGEGARASFRHLLCFAAFRPPSRAPATLTFDTYASFKECGPTNKIHKLEDIQCNTAPWRFVRLF
jgi:hypothetical protein